MKYRIIGATNLLLACLELFLSASYYFIIIPKLKVLYQAINSPMSSLIYIGLIILLLLGGISLFFGIKMFGEKREKFFAANVISLLVNFFLSMGILSFVYLNIIQSVYTLTS